MPDKEIQQEIAKLTSNASIPRRCSLFLFYTTLFPAIMLEEIRHLMMLNGSNYSLAELKKSADFLRSKHYLTLSYRETYNTLVPVPQSTIKRWAQAPYLLPCYKSAKKWAQETLRNQRTEPPFSPGHMLRLLALRNNKTEVWLLIKQFSTNSHSAYRFNTTANAITVFQQTHFFEDLTEEPTTSLEQLPQELWHDFLPTIYRNTSLDHLPQYLDEKALRSYYPERHDATDDISGVCLHIALQTGQWHLFEPLTKLGSCSHPPRKTKHGIIPAHPTLQLCELGKVLLNWRQGKWAALKKIKTYATSIQASVPPPEDAQLYAILAPLIFLMRFNTPKTHNDHLTLAKEGMRLLHGKSCEAFISNCYEAYTLTPATYTEEVWKNTRPLDMLPKALCLASLDSMPTIPEESLTELCRACNDLHNNGLTLYSWYMANALLCLPGISPEETAQLESILHSRTDLPLLFEIKKKIGIIDSLLDDMQDILLSPKQQTAEQAEGFISWRLSYKPRQRSVDYVYVYAHKKLKSGNFSTGKQLSADECFASKYQNYFSEQDNAILQHLRETDTTIHWMPYYKLTPELAKLLCGHPHIMLRTNAEDTPIELEPAPPELTIKNQKDGLTLTLQQFDPYVGVPLKHVKDNKYAIFCTDEKAKQLQKIVKTRTNNGSALKIPEQHKERLLSILSGFADSVSLQGNIANGKTKTLQAKPKVIALLEPGKGTLSGRLMLELYPGTHPVPYYSTAKMLFAHINGAAVNITRDSDSEQALREQLEQRCPTLYEVMDESAQWCLELSDTMLHLVEELQQCPATLLETRWQEDKKLRIDALSDFSAFNISAQNNSNRWLQIGGEVQVNETLVLQLSDLLRNINQSSGQYIELTNGHFLKLSKNIEEQLRALSALSQVPNKGKRTDKTVGVSPALLLMLAQTHGTNALPAALQQQADALLQQFNTTFYKPRNINASLRDYQTEGYTWMQRLMNCGLGACLADDMGLGKTLQVLCVLQARAAAGPSLVIAPASVCNNWSTEAAKFTPTLNIYQFETGDRKKLIKALGKRDVLICSYGLLVTEAELLASRKWNVVVLDEAQYIKNSQTQRARSACALQADCRIAATGTPIENSLDELWSIFDFINPGYLGSLEQFRTRFANNPTRRKLLRRIVAPFVLRRLKSDVLDELPEKTETTRSIILSPQERALYEACRRDALAQAQQSEDRFTILAQLMRLRRICCHPQLVDAKWKAEAGKLNALAEMATELRSSGHKALIFSQFTDMLALVRTRFEQEGFSYLYLDGSTPKNKRGKLVDDFQNGEADFFLISLKAGGTGLNLTAADYVILLDPWWNPAVESQAADRTHRIGQKRPVTVCRFVCQNTIEERVMELHAEKRELFDQVVNDTAKAAPLSLTELRELL